MRFSRLVIVLALLAAFASDSWGQSKRPPDRSQTQRTEQPPATDQRGTEKMPAFVKVLPSEDAEAKTDQEAADRASKDNLDRNTVRLGIASVIVALLQFVAIGIQAWFLWRTVKVSEKVANAAEASANAVTSQLRAYVNLSEGNVAHAPGSRPEIIIIIKNTGQTPATKLTWRAKFVVAALTDLSPLDLDPDAVGVEMALPPGEVLSYKYVFENWRPEFDGFLERRELFIFAVGEIRYEDVFGNKRFTDYCFLSGGRFDTGSGIGPGKFGPYREGNNSN